MRRTREIKFLEEIKCDKVRDINVLSQKIMFGLELIWINLKLIKRWPPERSLVNEKNNFEKKITDFC